MTNEDNKEDVQDDSESERLDFGKPDFTFIPKGNHDYKQRGYYLICKSCEIEHAVFVGADKIMVGIEDDGKPIMKSRKELGMA